MQFVWLVLPVTISVVGIVMMLVRRARRVLPTPRELGSRLASAEVRATRPLRAGRSGRQPRG